MTSIWRTTHSAEYSHSDCQPRIRRSAGIAEASAGIHVSLLSRLFVPQRPGDQTLRTPNVKSRVPRLYVSFLRLDFRGVSFDSENGPVRLACGKRRFTLEGTSPDILSADGPCLYLGAPPRLRDEGKSLGATSRRLLLARKARARPIRGVSNQGKSRRSSHSKMS